MLKTKDTTPMTQFRATFARTIIQGGTAFAAATALLAILPGALAKPEEYVVDKDHSKVGFEVKHLVFATVDGKFNSFSGDFVFDPQNLEIAKLNATVDASSIDTGIDKRDKHLKSADFFEASKYPKMTFKSKRAKKIDNDTFEIAGDLTIKKNTKEVTFVVDFLGQMKAYEKNRAAFSATTKINRKEFGLTWNEAVEAGPVVGDDVVIRLNVQGIRKGDL